MNNLRKYLLATFSFSLLLSFGNCSLVGGSDDNKDQNLIYAAFALQLASSRPTLSTLTATGFNKPEAIGFNAVDSTLIVADTKNSQIKKITSETTVTTLLDTNGVGGSPLSSPEGLCVDSSGTTFVNNTDGHNIIRITSAGVATAYAGQSATSGSTNGTVSTATAMFNGPEGIFCGTNSSLFIADVGNNQIRKILSSTVSLVAGSTAGTSGFVNGNGTAASFNAPKGIAVDSAGNIYVADNGNHAIRKISTTGDVTTLAGSTAGVAGATDGTGTAARFNKPYALTIDASDNLYTTDSANNLIRKITSAGVVTTVVGSGVAGSLDGIGTSATMSDPRGIVYDSVKKVIYITTAGDNKIRKISGI